MSGRGALLRAFALIGLLLLAASARAQFVPMPNPIPPEPRWGDYDESHSWRDAGWW